ncbi:MAG TPA: anti-sigma factor [Candidatus Limnocylindrales bacterium]|nr:anti-sigma factor [Candidatus Limnocylindrales bacterium]
MADRLVAGIRCSELSDLAPAFVLGALAPAEMATVRAHLAECPEAHAEFEELGSVLPALLASVDQVEPSEALLGRILDAASADRTRTATPATAPTRDIRSAPSLQDRLGLGSSRSRPAWAALGIAAVLAVVVLGTWNVQLQASNQELAAYQRGVAAVIEAASRPGAQLAVLAASSPSSPAAGIAAVRPDGTVAIAMRGLAPTTGSQVYEAWLVAGNAAPLPIGGFQVGGSGSGTLVATNATPSPGVIVALTLELGPGATTPTLPLIASGAAQVRPG